MNNKRTIIRHTTVTLSASDRTQRYTIALIADSENVQGNVCYEVRCNYGTDVQPAALDNILKVTLSRTDAERAYDHHLLSFERKGFRPAEPDLETMSRTFKADLPPAPESVSRQLIAVQSGRLAFA